MSKMVKEVTYSGIMINVLGFLGIFPLLMIYMLVYRKYFYGKLADAEINFTLLLISLLLISLLVHEALHGVGWVLTKGCTFKNIHLKFNFLMASGHCDKPLKGSKYIFGLAFPFAILVPGTMILSFVFPSIVTVFTAIINITLCGGDLILFFKIIPYRNKQIIDHPSKAGFAIVE